MRVDALDYDYDEQLVAQTPLPDRDGARLFVIGANGQKFTHRTVRDLAVLLPPSLLIVNDTRVFPARLIGSRTPTGGRVEVFLVRRLETDGAGTIEEWLALGRASKALRPGTEVVFGRSADLRATVVERGADGLFRVRLEAPNVAEAIAAEGRVPLPPYIRRDATAEDRERYQTIFAAHPGAVAAPTAGLHLSQGLVTALRSAGHHLEAVTLHVGLGTFAPVTADDLDDHMMHTEEFSISDRVVTAVEDAQAEGRSVVAVGTTVVRALEAAALAGEAAGRPGRLWAGSGRTDLLIQPGYRFRVVDTLLTNFHQPRSTLLALVMAFAGIDRTRRAYGEAQRLRYRLFSYGDAMLVCGARGEG